MKIAVAGPQVADRFDFFHAAAFDRFERDRHADESHEFAVRPIAREQERPLKLARLPPQPARLAAHVGRRAKILLQLRTRSRANSAAARSPSIRRRPRAARFAKRTRPQPRRTNNNRT